MKKLFFILLTILSSAAAGASYFYLSGKMAFCFAFLCGALSGIFLMNIFIYSKNKKINSYARELEKESVISSESSSRVRVLESKIEVLEKALENALKK